MGFGDLESCPYEYLPGAPHSNAGKMRLRRVAFMMLGMIAMASSHAKSSSQGCRYPLTSLSASSSDLRQSIQGLFKWTGERKDIIWKHAFQPTSSEQEAYVAKYLVRPGEYTVGYVFHTNIFVDNSC